MPIGEKRTKQAVINMLTTGIKMIFKIEDIIKAGSCFF